MGVKITFVGILPLLLVVAGTFGAVGLGVTHGVMKANFVSDVGHHVQEAFDAVSAEMTVHQLDQAIEILDEKGLNEGYTSWLWHTKETHIGFWYDTLVEARADAKRASYEGAWMPEADENNLLHRHYQVLTNTFGSDMMPDYIHLGQSKPVHDALAWVFTSSVIGGLIWHVMRFVYRVPMDRCLRHGKAHWENPGCHTEVCPRNYSIAEYPSSFYKRYVPDKE